MGAKDSKKKTKEREQDLEKEVALFESLGGGEAENFILMEVGDRTMICADLSEDLDGSDILPLYVRLSPEETADAREAIEGGRSEVVGDDEDERPRKRWSPS